MWVACPEVESGGVRAHAANFKKDVVSNSMTQLKLACLGPNATTLVAVAEGHPEQS